MTTHGIGVNTGPQRCSSGPAYPTRRWAFHLALVILGGALTVGCSPLAKRPNIRSFSNFVTGPSTVVQDMQDLPADAATALRRADAASGMDNHDEALYYYVKALEFDAKNARALARIGAIHQEKGNLELAEAAYRMALTIEPRNADALEGLGLLLLHGRKYADAKTSLTAALAADRRRWRTHNGLGIIADLEANHGLAQVHYQNALTIQPNDPLLLTNFGYSKYLSGDWPGALSLYDSALHQDGRYASAWLNKGLIFARQGKDSVALDAFRHVLDEADAYNDLGYIYMLNGQTDKAYEYFQQAITLSPSYHELAEENLKRLSAAQ